MKTNKNPAAPPDPTTATARVNEIQGATFSVVVPPAVFELASDLWEPLEPVECEGHDVRTIRTDEV